VSCRELVALGETSLGAAAVRDMPATSIIAEGLRAKILALHEAGKLQGIIAITGMTGALISLAAMKALPFGIPKLLISGATAQPIHASQFANYFAVQDITVMNTVVDRWA